MNIGLDALLLRFPEYGEQIKNQIRENDEFRSLCADYELCIVTLLAINQEKEISQAKLQEYLEIKTELEQEVLKYM
jgi:hypothetical protein